LAHDDPGNALRRKRYAAQVKGFFPQGSVGSREEAVPTFPSSLYRTRADQPVMKEQQSIRGWTVGLGLLLLMLSCHRRHSTPSSGAQGPAMRKATQPTQLLVDATSPYVAGLAVDAEAIYLLTERVAHRFASGASPQQIPIENGTTAAVTRTDLVYWSKGAIWQVPKAGGQAQKIVSLAHQPQSFLAAGDDFAWLDMPVPDQFQIQTLVDHNVRTLLYYVGRIETAAMDAGRVFFVKKEAASTWRIGSVFVHGGETAYGAPHTGPTPAKLAVAGDVFYYELNSGEIRRLSPDLSHEEVLKKDLICSPIAVSSSIYCANLEGLFRLARHPGAKTQPIFPEARRIAAVAASATQLVWLSDVGPDRLSLMTLPLMRDDAE
jgi:hypothetical protein